MLGLVSPMKNCLRSACAPRCWGRSPTGSRCVSSREIPAVGSRFHRGNRIARGGFRPRSHRRKRPFPIARQSENGSILLGDHAVFIGKTPESSEESTYHSIYREREWLQRKVRNAA